jgi:hypothetical protein
MAIPKQITENHILSAIQEIENMIEIPKSRKSKKYFLKYNNHLYPLKYVISIANRYALGYELNPDAKVFNTYMAQDYLIKKGFTEIVELKKNNL